MQRRVVALLAVLALVAPAACDSSTDGLPILTDPAEVLAAAASSTASLRTVHTRIDLSVAAAGGDIADRRLTVLIESDIDVQTRNVAGRARTRTQDDAERVDESEFVIVDGARFDRVPPAVRWLGMAEAGGDHLPTTPEYVAAIDAAVQRGGIVLDLAEAEACGEATCYHLTVRLDELTTWQLLVGPLSGRTPIGGGPPEPELVPGPATVDIYVDRATRLLVGLTGAFSVAEASVAFSIAFSNHDAPLAIVAPPPGLVDDGGGLEGGAGPPQPAPVQEVTPAPSVAAP